MAWALFLHLYAIPVLALRLLAAVPAEGWRNVWKRLPIFILLWFVFSLTNLLHIIGHLIDELVFFSYRKTPVHKPVFILGIPRSGTTFLQRLFSTDKRFSTFSTWEAVLAPSISERYVYRAIGVFLKPLVSLFGTGRVHMAGQMDAIHRIGLAEPEEDFLLLLPIQGCLLLTFLCPGTKQYWQLAYFDTALPESYRKRLLNFYSLCLKKHLYFHGKDKTMLSKNPSFTSLLPSLLETFPEAKIIACTRDPVEVVPSQLSSLRPAMRLLGHGRLSAKMQTRMIDLLHHYYELLGKIRQDGRIIILPMMILQTQLKQTLENLYALFNMQPSENILAVETAAEDKKHQYSSKHNYTLSEFSLSEQFVESKFADVWPLPSPHEIINAG